MTPRIKVIINGKVCSGRAGQTILDIAENNGIAIPNLCHNGELKHYGGCSLCVVEAEGSPKLLRACSTVAQDGQVIYTTSREISEQISADDISVINSYTCGTYYSIYETSDSLGNARYLIFLNSINEDTGSAEILESCVLEGVAPGEYFLAAQPIKYGGLDGAQVRPLLIQMD